MIGKKLQVENLKENRCWNCDKIEIILCMGYYFRIQYKWSIRIGRDVWFYLVGNVNKILYNFILFLLKWVIIRKYKIYSVMGVKNLKFCVQLEGI